MTCWRRAYNGLDAGFWPPAPGRHVALASRAPFCDTRAMSSPSALARLRRWFSGNTPAGAPGPAGTPAAKPGPHASGLRQQRAGRREQLFALVRENMIRMGVLSSHYKFKVLTLDPAGEQFIVMVDWQPGALGADPVFEKQFEAGLQHLLVERQQGFKVKAVYWRGHVEGGVAAGLPPARATHPTPATAPAPVAPAVHREEQVSDDELKALHAALRQAGASPQAAPATSRRAAPVMPPPLQDPPDFEPTINTEGQQGTEFGSLSETQYGKLN